MRRQGRWGWMLAAGGAVCGAACGGARGQMVAAMSAGEVRREEAARERAVIARAARVEEPVSKRNLAATYRPVVEEEEVVAEAVARGEEMSFWRGWDGTVDAGVTGSSGNSENFSLRMGFTAVRKAREMETALDGSYTWETDAGEKSKSRGEANARNDWNFEESRWFVFAVGKGEYDEFQDWRWRFSGIVGPGYALIRDEKTTLKVRAGAGFAHELGGSRNEWIPELDVGFDFERQLTERQKVFVTHDTFPSVEDFANFRTVTKAGWEMLVDPEVNLVLKVGIEHRHESEQREGFKKNDLEYFATVGWRF